MHSELGEIGSKRVSIAKNKWNNNKKQTNNKYVFIISFVQPVSSNDIAKQTSPFHSNAWPMIQSNDMILQLEEIAPASQWMTLTILWLSSLKYCTWAYVTFMDGPSVLQTREPSRQAY